jgi:hypothetical protein
MTRMRTTDDADVHKAFADAQQAYANAHNRSVELLLISSPLIFTLP